MNPLRLIEKKRDGGSLSAAEWRFIIQSYLSGQLPHYQMSALLMAVYFSGMDYEETATLTGIMVESGERLDLRDIAGAKIDKHSTGGVGDKVSLILAPLMAAAGIRVPMISGRGLAHTGGTLDKLESIPGFRTRLTPKEFHQQINDIGVAMIGQSDRIVPADKKIYALRDATSTVASIPLITASILSKKIAAGVDGLVMDIKTGCGAFMARMEQAEKLAQSILRTAVANALPTVALITAMDQPLGNAAGNWLEVLEVLQALQNRGPDDLMKVVYALGAQMLHLAEGVSQPQQAQKRLQTLIRDGAAMDKFLQMVAAQGGDTRILRDAGKYPMAKFQQHLRSHQNGWVHEAHALKIGYAVVLLGGGRRTMNDTVDPAAGIVLQKKIGDQVEKGDILAVLHTNRTNVISEAARWMRSAFRIGPEQSEKPRTVLKLLT
ncbi:thymidine phosphorylase [candidate division KSB1 bacterium]|nr:thymidine phosphorylase [candidate division KSB1 bacterium]